VNTEDDSCQKLWK